MASEISTIQKLEGGDFVMADTHALVISEAQGRVKSFQEKIKTLTKRPLKVIKAEWKYPKYKV